MPPRFLTRSLAALALAAAAGVAMSQDTCGNIIPHRGYAQHNGKLLATLNSGCPPMRTGDSPLQIKGPDGNQWLECGPLASFNMVETEETCFGGRGPGSDDSSMGGGSYMDDSGSDFGFFSQAYGPCKEDRPLSSTECSMMPLCMPTGVGQCRQKRCDDRPVCGDGEEYYGFPCGMGGDPGQTPSCVPMCPFGPGSLQCKALGLACREPRSAFMRGSECNLGICDICCDETRSSNYCARFAADLRCSCRDDGMSDDGMPGSYDGMSDDGMPGSYDGMPGSYDGMSDDGMPGSYDGMSDDGMPGSYDGMPGSYDGMSDDGEFQDNSPVTGPCREAMVHSPSSCMERPYCGLTEGGCRQLACEDRGDPLGCSMHPNFYGMPCVPTDEGSFPHCTSQCPFAGPSEQCDLYMEACSRNPASAFITHPDFTMECHSAACETCCGAPSHEYCMMYQADLQCACREK